METAGSTSEPPGLGSVWRRWDPHVHFPGTLHEDRFGELSVGEALDDLASCTPAIEVIGVTDYFTTLSFRRALAAWKAGSGRGIKLIFPNVEVRLAIPTRDGAAVNVHLMCAPEHVDWLDQFLGTLTFVWDDRRWRADDRGLIDLGRSFRDDPDLSDAAARDIGANQFKVSLDELRKRVKEDRLAAARLVIGFAGGDGDGTSGVRTEDGAFAAQRQSIERLAHVIFSGNPKQAEFWTGKGRDDLDTLGKKYGGAKLCLHGSDAHVRAKLGKPALNRYTWIKGGATFDALKFACLAPDTRGWVGESSPAVGQEHGRISSVSVHGSWFANGTVPVNAGLVAIIGARGSGKTALADLIAAGAGSAEPSLNPSSFIRRAGNLVDAASAEVTWRGQLPTKRALVDSLRPDEGRVRYLSQQFVERLCASDGISDDLLAEIERVIYNSWPIENRLGASDFQELLGLRLAPARERQRLQLELLGDISDQITAQRVLQNGLKDKTELRAAQSAQALRLDGQIEELTSQSAGAAHAERHGLVSRVLASRQEELQAVDRRRIAVRALSSAVNSAEASQFPQYVENLRTKHSATGLDDGDWDAFLPVFAGDVRGIVERALGEADAAYDGLLGVAPVAPTNLDNLDEVQLRSRSVSELRAEQARLQTLVGLDKERSGRLTKLQGQVAEVRNRIVTLDGEIEAAKGAGARINTLVEQRSECYASYFGALLEEETELRSLYGPLDDILSQAGKSVSKLRLSIRRRVDIEAWGAQGEALIDLRIGGAFRGIGELAKAAKESLESAWRDGDGEAAAAAIQQFSIDHSSDLRAQGRVSRQDEASYREWERGVARWLYSVDHIRVVYDLEYDGLSVERLSPGTRGIVLLLLYLAVDQVETEPLIIDQPEENLDPESIYTELVALFRGASKRRQIIMVTHNANLVVNTDVDQVVIAHCGPLQDGRLPEFTYTSGGLDEPAIRAAVCGVLEGGATAFRERARRLGIDDTPIADELADTTAKAR